MDLFQSSENMDYLSHGVLLSFKSLISKARKHGYMVKNKNKIKMKKKLWLINIGIMLLPNPHIILKPHHPFSLFNLQTQPSSPPNP